MRQAVPGGASASQKLATLARLQRAVRAAHLGENDQAQIAEAIGAVGANLEADANLIAQIVRAQVSAPQKLAALLKLAVGEAGPLGPAADRARSEAIKLLRAPDVRTALSAAPESVAALKGLMQAAGLAA